MPNVRAAHKKAVSTWIPRELKDDLVRIARKEDLTLAAYVQKLYEAAVEKNKKKAARKGKGR